MKLIIYYLILKASNTYVHVDNFLFNFSLYKNTCNTRYNMIHDTKKNRKMALNMFYELTTMEEFVSLRCTSID